MNLDKRTKIIYLALGMVIVVSFLVKFFNRNSASLYGAEIAQHYLEIIKLNQGQLLLAGPLTSHVWLRLSATPYYLFYPLFVVTQFHPLTLPIVWILVSCLGPLISYLVISRIYNRLTGITSAWLYLLSPNILLIDHSTGFFAFIIPLSYVLIYQSYRVFFQQSKKLWLMFLIISLMMTLHAAAFMFLPFYIGAAIYWKKFNRRSLAQSLVAFLVPQLPLLLNETNNHFSSIVQFSLWIPYKVINFISGRTLGVEGVTTQDTSLQLIINFFKLSVLPPTLSWLFGLIILAIFMGAGIHFLRTKKLTFDSFLLILLLYGCLTLLIHKNPPHHYFVPLMTLPLILIAHWLNILFKSPPRRLVSLLLLISLTALNLRFIFSPEYLFKPPTHPFAHQKQISQVIIDDAHNQPFALQRIGEFDHYQNYFQENYEYLLWWLGNRPLPTSSTQYVIVEDRSRTPSDEEFVKVGDVENIAIFKKR